MSRSVVRSVCFHTSSRASRSRKSIRKREVGTESVDMCRTREDELHGVLVLRLGVRRHVVHIDRHLGLAGVHKIFRARLEHVEVSAFALLQEDRDDQQAASQNV